VGLQSKALTSFLQMREAMHMNPLLVPTLIVLLRAHVWRRGVVLRSAHRTFAEVLRCGLGWLPLFSISVGRLRTFGERIVTPAVLFVLTPVPLSNHCWTHSYEQAEGSM
jgi:hypothetical protein